MLLDPYRQINQQKLIDGKSKFFYLPFYKPHVLTATTEITKKKINY